MVVDARGLGCPKPIIMAEEAVSAMSEGIVEVLVDNEASVKNLARFARNNSLYYESEKADNYWRIKLVKGYPCEGLRPPAELASQALLPETAEAGRKGMLLVIGTDSLGRDEDLGRRLMKGFFETMKAYRELPDTVFFLNRGVRLTTVDEEIYPVLAEMEKLGVEIFSCGTCLDHYGLAAELKVGYRGTTNHIVEGLKDFRKIVWI
jgi:selenium metabolism protein YedF